MFILVRGPRSRSAATETNVSNATRKPMNEKLIYEYPMRFTKANPRVNNLCKTIYTDESNALYLS